MITHTWPAINYDFGCCYPITWWYVLIILNLLLLPRWRMWMMVCGERLYRRCESVKVTNIFSSKLTDLDPPDPLSERGPPKTTCRCWWMFDVYPRRSREAFKLSPRRTGVGSVHAEVNGYSVSFSSGRSCGMMRLSGIFLVRDLFFLGLVGIRSFPVG